MVVKKTFRGLCGGRSGANEATAPPDGDDVAKKCTTSVVVIKTPPFVFEAFL